MRLPVSLDHGAVHLLAGAPPGQDARLLAGLAQKSAQGVLHICRNEAELAVMMECLALFAPDVTPLPFPGWDCLPYDRVSPRPDITAQRVETLVALAKPAPHRLVLTTISAFIQRIPPLSHLSAAVLDVQIGDRLPDAQLRDYLTRNGYHPAETVREPGEYALRGNIVDLFPPGSETPLRLDLFGDEVESIRSFDPLSQRSLDKLDRLSLKPMAEFALDPASIQHFREGYRRHFGAVNDEDMLYAAVSAGLRHGGMEHWLPLFYGEMQSLADLMPDAVLSFCYEAEAAIAARLEQVQDFFAARQSLFAAQSESGQPVSYKPLPPDSLYHTRSEMEAIQARHPLCMLSPYAPDRKEGATDGQGRRGWDFADSRSHPDVHLFDAVRDHIARIREEDPRLTVLIAGYSTGSVARLKTMCAERNIGPLTMLENGTPLDLSAIKGQIGLCVLGLEHGFTAPDMILLTEQDILGDRIARATPRKRRKAEAFLQEIESLSPGDLVVHVEHGIGRYDGLETIETLGAPHDFLKLTYADAARLYVPVENIELLSRYGSGQSDLALTQMDRLGGTAWQARKAKVKKNLLEMAEELMQIAATRSLGTVSAITPPDGDYQEFCARFPYAETEDQLEAIADIEADFAKGQPMDRLVCGDVGFGKTEVALRAAFIAAMAGQQVAIVVPTTLLSRQHYATFQARFKGLPIRIGHLSRLVSAREAKATREELAKGRLDIVIGTHALLAQSIRFADLGLMIIDEEQRFGVKQKERLKSYRESVHVLTLTATPIPRTLQLSLSGVKELSLITTPPVDRLAVRSFITPQDAVVLKEAIKREVFRGGQIFYVCPRISHMAEMRAFLEEITPDLRIVSANGQMPSAELEEVMGAFDAGQFDLLLATNIIENGIDIPNANTLIVHRADMFSLAQLYQLRGRVGRSKLRGYAYFTHDPKKPLGKVAQERLHVLERLDQLGAGFTLASYDLDIRGAGNLLGDAQSGHIKEIGIELYQQMLEEAVAEARHKSGEMIDVPADHSWTPQINIGMSVLIPERYVKDLNIRLSLYRRIGQLVEKAEVEAFAAELIDRFGVLPQEVENLLELVTIKHLCKRAGVARVEAGSKGAVVSFREDRPPNVPALMDYVAQSIGTVKIRPDQKLSFIRMWDSQARRVSGLRQILSDLAALAENQAAT